MNKFGTKIAIRKSCVLSRTLRHSQFSSPLPPCVVELQQQRWRFSFCKNETILQLYEDQLVCKQCEKIKYLNLRYAVTI